MSRGLLSGLDRAEKDPYKGWKTNNFQADSPENDEVCLLDDDNDDESSSSYRSTKCLSDGNRNPNDFQAKDNSYTIPRKVNAPFDKAKKGSSWFNSSFNEKDHTPSRNCHTRNINTRMTQRNEIGYRVMRQGQLGRLNKTPSSRWKHASPPGELSALRNKPSISQQEKILSCQVQDADTSEKCNGFESENTARTANTFNSLKEEQERSRSMLDCIMQGSSKKSLSNTALNKDENTRTESTNSDINLTLKSSSPELHDSLTSSKDAFSDDNYDDAFKEHCTKCMTRLSQDSMCPACNKDIFPSHAATPRKHLSPGRFYSSKKVRTYPGTKKCGTGVPRLCAAPDTKPSTTKKSVGSSQATSGRKKRKNQRKSHSDDSDPEFQPGNKKRGGKQLKLDAIKKVDVITLSDEEEVIGTENSEPKTEEAPELTVEESSQSDAKDSPLRSDSVTLVPESPNENSMESPAESESTEKSGKRKAPLLEVHEEQQSKKKGGVYNRDDLELQIMIGQEVHLGTLACTAVEPLKITANGRSDEIKLSVDCGSKIVLLTISGKDLTSLKISRGQDPDVIVLGVTPGFALKLMHKFPFKGSAFLNPGSAVASERDIILEVSERVTKEIIHDLMDWVSEKLSKDFAELSLKEVERIKSFKASTSASATKEKEQSPSETSSTSMTTRSRTYSTRTSGSKEAAAKTVEKLIVYPAPPQPGGITVTSEDIPCLAPGEFLNDVIIDFYLKYVFEKLKPEDKARTHILSSFFYKRLTQKNNKHSDSFTSTPDRMHSQVRTWTKNVDIFEKDFVFLPINESSHWYLAVICFAGHTEPTYINEILDEDEETQQKKDSESDAATEKESENDNNNDVDDDDDVELPTLTSLQSKSLSRSRRKSSLPKQSIKSQPCILVFDSLGCQRNRCMMNLRNYLACEWKERKKECEPREFNKDNVKGNHPKAPVQDNFCDCGVYVLQYMESFFKDPITDFSFPIRKTDWFGFEEIAQKRKDIKELIYKLKADADSAGDT